MAIGPIIIVAFPLASIVCLDDVDHIKRPMVTKLFISPGHSLQGLGHGVGQLLEVLGSVNASGEIRLRIT
jgi:hypothetical protein